jgi:putative thioredoxin
MDEAKAALAEKQYGVAARIFAQVLQADREHAGAIAGLARCQIEAGELENAKATLALVPPSKSNDADVASARAALELKLDPPDTSRIGQLTAAIGKDPADHQLRFDLALALHGADQREQALDHLLHIVRHQRDWNEEAARKQLVKFFEAWGPKDELTLLGRRRLSSILFS